MDTGGSDIPIRERRKQARKEGRKEGRKEDEAGLLGTEDNLVCAKAAPPRHASSLDSRSGPELRTCVGV
jgi:hypothetical protein